MLAAQGGVPGLKRVFPFGCSDGPRGRYPCDGKAAPAAFPGNAGQSGADPQGLPGVANLAKGTIVLDQLQGVESLLPAYDQVQLDMVRCCQAPF